VIQLGCHAMEEDAARACNKYLEDGVNHVEPREATNTSHFTGVCWEKPRDKWRAKWKGKWLGYHTMEGDAPRAYNVVEAERLGLTVNVIPPAGAAGEDAGVAGGAAPKRAAPKFSPAAPAPSKKRKL